MTTQYHSVLVNTPVSSPLHPQLNLPLLKGFLAEHGYDAKVLDSNIEFFKEFVGHDYPRIGSEDCDENPLVMLSYYNDLENCLWDKSQAFEDLQYSLRSLSMKQDRLFFNSIISALRDKAANPFIDFWEKTIKTQILPTGAKIVGIAVTFQDQLIPAYTLADQIRQIAPELKIVLGGQMITRCYDSMLGHKEIMEYADYLALWDGEIPILNIHDRVYKGSKGDFTNVIDTHEKEHTINRNGAYTKGHNVPSPDFTDLDFSAYAFPENLIPLQTTRGCYAKCAFCAIPFGANGYRVRNADDIIEDILAIQELTKSRTGRKATFFKFMEDTSAPSLLFDLSKRIEERCIDAKWETFARLEQAFAKPGMMEQLYRGGCRKIHWGLESNDPDILKDMNKKTSMSYTDEVMKLSADSGIMNFCFILVGFPGENEKTRDNLTRYIINNNDIHTLTISTFDLTRRSPMADDFVENNPYGLDMAPAQDFQVRLPYTVNGEDWKKDIVPAAHRMMANIIRERPDIGFVTLFPDQIRGMFCDKYGNDWGRTFVQKYGKENIQEMLLNTENYISAYNSKQEIDPSALPEPLRREHFRTKEDMKLLASAVLRRKDYERRRIEQV
jgi:tRNA A37 methylthiotransferase MiaB